MHEIGNTAVRSLAGYVRRYVRRKNGNRLDVGITGKYGEFPVATDQTPYRNRY